MKTRRTLPAWLKYFFIIVSICAVGVLMLYILSDILFTNRIIAELPKAKSSECYYSDGFQDYTDYCKYRYTDKALNALEKSSHFKKVSEEDTAEIQSYFENFEGWVKYVKYRDSYDFDKSVISPGDYFCIQNRDTYEKYAHYHDKYAAYNVYFFDTETLTLYFIHNNI
ncbi:MAG: hypothetical protein J1F64_05510 [Oscillospiraceae bacterium]|nr:hypothetical protein [Oscillospiraceae bacterium]